MFDRSDDTALDDFAKAFQVSPQAMMLWLQNLGLLVP